MEVSSIIKFPYMPAGYVFRHSMSSLDGKNSSVAVSVLVIAPMIHSDPYKSTD
jgi:hypothetical protein